MSKAPNFTLIEPAMEIHRRAFAVHSDLVASINPQATNPLYDGEFLTLAGYKAKRGSGNGAVPAWACFDLRGQYDVQAAQKVTLLYGGFYEAETSLFTAGSIAEGDPLVVANVTVDGQAKRGLIELPTAAGTYVIVGYASKTPAGGKLRFISTSPQRVVVA